MQTFLVDFMQLMALNHVGHVISFEFLESADREIGELVSAINGLSLSISRVSEMKTRLPLVVSKICNGDDEEETASSKDKEKDAGAAVAVGSGLAAGASAAAATSAVASADVNPIANTTEVQEPSENDRLMPPV